MSVELNIHLGFDSLHCESQCLEVDRLVYIPLYFSPFHLSFLLRNTPKRHSTRTSAQHTLQPFKHQRIPQAPITVSAVPSFLSPTYMMLTCFSSDTSQNDSSSTTQLVNMGNPNRRDRDQQTTTVVPRLPQPAPPPAPVVVPIVIPVPPRTTARSYERDVARKSDIIIGPGGIIVNMVAVATTSVDNQIVNRSVLPFDKTDFVVYFKV